MLQLISSLGHQIPIQHQDQPGKQSDMKGPDPVTTEIPTEDGGYQTYKAAGKLKGKKAIITGGDSGIGRAIAVLFAMEGADSLIAYLPEEQEDADATKKMVEEKGQKCYCLPTDVRKQENCKKIVDEAMEKMGAINIVVNNAAYQNMINGIAELSEYVHLPPIPCAVTNPPLPENNGSKPSTQTSTPTSSSPNTPSRT